MIPRVELAMKSANAFSGRILDSKVLEPDQKEFSGKIDDPQMIVSSKMKSRTGLNKIDETCGYSPVEVCDLLVNERSAARHIHTPRKNLIAIDSVWKKFQKARQQQWILSSNQMLEDQF